MRIRIRGPAGQSVIAIPESATVGDLRLQIVESTSLPHFDAKYGYPPKPFMLEAYESSTKLSDLSVKLAGEQLIISRRETPVTSTDSRITRKEELNSSEEGVSYEDANSRDGTGDVRHRNDLSGFSSGGVGTPSPPGNGATLESRDSQPLVPMPLTRQKNISVESDPPELPFPSRRGTLLLRIMPDDNSCLFRAFGSAFFGFMDSMTELRSLVAQQIQAKPELYTHAVLDQKPDDYCRWIQTEDAWGGGIELSILSKHFDLEICSIDVQTLRVDRFNEGQSKRCFLVYSGIHYDMIALSPSDPPHEHAYAPPEFDITIFDSSDQLVLDKAAELCKVLQGKHYYTDTAAFIVKCNVCGGHFAGERGATEHAKQSGHYDFSEGG